MSLQIGKNYLAMATSIKVAVDSSKLGPRQIAGLKRMVKTGIISGDTPQALLAVAVRKNAGLGYLQIARYHVEWAGINPDCTEFFDRVKAAHTAFQLENPDPGQYVVQYWNAAVSAANRRNATHKTYHIGDYLKKVFSKSSPLPLMVAPMEVKFEIEMLDQA